MNPNDLSEGTGLFPRKKVLMVCPVNIHTIVIQPPNGDGHRFQSLCVDSEEKDAQEFYTEAQSGTTEKKLIMLE